MPLAGYLTYVPTATRVRGRRAFAGALRWTQLALCRGQTELFFPPFHERPERRARREHQARAVCAACPVLEPCRGWARENHEYGFWGGESEEERAEAGYRAAISGGEQIDWSAAEWTGAVPVRQAV